MSKMTPEQMKWGGYRSFEGCFHHGTLPVKTPKEDAPYAEKVVALVAAAEGGYWDSLNMYDSGMLSLGAIQFIDVAPQLSVTKMLDEVCKKVGYEKVLAELEPALKVSGGEYKIDPASQKYRFFLNGSLVATKLQQNMLYFGDGTGNAKGSYDAVKRKICRTWGACVMNVMAIPGAIEAQSEFTYKRIMSDFTWGKTKILFQKTDLNEYGWEGAIRALVISYAVNSPKTAMNRVEAFLLKTKEQSWTPVWCLEMLRSVAVDGGISIWTTRYKSQIAKTKEIFGIELPSWNDLVLAKWRNNGWSHPCLTDVKPILVETPAPTPIAEEQTKVEPEPAPVVVAPSPKESALKEDVATEVKNDVVLNQAIETAVKAAPSIPWSNIGKLIAAIMIPVAYLVKWLLSHFRK